LRLSPRNRTTPRKTPGTTERLLRGRSRRGPPPSSRNIQVEQGGGLSPICTYNARHSVSFLSAAEICKYHLQLSARNPRLTSASRLTARGGWRSREGPGGGRWQGRGNGVNGSPPLLPPREAVEFSRKRERRGTYSSLLSLSRAGHEKRAKQREKISTSFHPPPQVTRVRNRGRYQGERVINSDRPGATLIILLLEFARALSLSLSLYLSIYLIIIGWRHRASFSSLPS